MNRLIFDKSKAYRNCAKFLVHPVCTCIRQIVPLDPSSLGLGGRDYYNSSDSTTQRRRLDAYKTYMTTVARLLNATDSDADKFVHNTIELERKLVQVGELLTASFRTIINRPR